MFETPGCSDAYCDSPENIGDGNGVHDVKIENVKIRGENDQVAPQGGVFILQTRDPAQSSHAIYILNVDVWHTWADCINLHGAPWDVTVEGCKCGWNGDDNFAVWSQGDLAHDLFFKNNWASQKSTEDPDWGNCFAIYGGGQNIWVRDSECEETTNAAVKVSWDFRGSFSDWTTINIENVATDDGKPVCFFDNGRDVLLQNQVFGCEWADPGTIVNAYSGKCLDLPDGNAFNGANLQVWDCNGMFNQQWIWTDGSNIIRPQVDPSKCVEAGQWGNGKQLFLWDCNGQPQQNLMYDTYGMKTIYFPASETAGFGTATACVEVPFGGLTAGQAAWMWECNGGPNQRWEVGTMPSSSVV